MYATKTLFIFYLCFTREKGSLCACIQRRRAFRGTAVYCCDDGSIIVKERQRLKNLFFNFKKNRDTNHPAQDDRR